MNHSCREKRSTYDPGVLERHHMIDINIGRCRPRRAVVRAEPGASRGRAGRVDNNAGSVTLEDDFTIVLSQLQAQRFSCRLGAISTHRVLQLSPWSIQWGNRSRSYVPSSTCVATVRAASCVFAEEADGMPGCVKHQTQPEQGRDKLFLISYRSGHRRRRREGGHSREQAEKPQEACCGVHDGGSVTGDIVSQAVGVRVGCKTAVP